MDQPHRPLSALTSQELLARAIEYRRMASNANGAATIESLNALAVRFAVLAARRAVEEKSASSEEDGQGYSEVDRLARLALRAAAGIADPVQGLADAIKCVAGGDADPYLVMGALIEGTVHVLIDRIPAECQNDAASAILKLLADRLHNAGLMREQ